MAPRKSAEVLKCSRCDYTTHWAHVLGTHMRYAHGMKGKKQAQGRKPKMGRPKGSSMYATHADMAEMRAYYSRRRNYFNRLVGAWLKVNMPDVHAKLWELVEEKLPLPLKLRVKGVRAEMLKVLKGIE